MHKDGEVLAGVRLTPTTHRCGIYTYMIRDAQRGLLETIPRDLLNFEAPVDPNIWESSRVFVSNDVPAADRLRVQMQLIHEMVDLGPRSWCNDASGDHSRAFAAPRPQGGAGLRAVGPGDGHGWQQVGLRDDQHGDKAALTLRHSRQPRQWRGRIGLEIRNRQPRVVGQL